MAYYTASQSYGTTGIKTITCGFQPVAMRISVGAKAGSAPTVSQFSVGTADGTRQNYISLYSDATGSQSKQSNNKMISHYERVSGTMTEVIAGTWDSFTATEGKFNLSAANNNYTLVIELWD